MPKFKPGQSGNPKGRRKGTPNKNTAALKEMVMNALIRAGGEEYLLRQAEENPKAFMALVGRLLPPAVNENDTDLMDSILARITHIRTVVATPHPSRDIANFEAK